MTGFITLEPLPMTEDMLVSSTIPEDDRPEWAEGTYEQFDEVIWKHVIYRDGLGGESLKEPDTDRSRWIRFNPTNRWKPFDQAQVGLAFCPFSAVYVFKPGQIVSGFIALAQEDTESMRVVMEDPVDGIVYDRVSSDEILPISTSWFDWLYTPYTKTELWRLYDDLPAYPNATLTVTFVGGPNMKVGPILFGRVREIGSFVARGGSLYPTDYSSDTEDEFGNWKYVKRGWSAGGEFTLSVDVDALDAAYNHFISLRGKPTVLIPTDMFTSTIFYGRLTMRILLQYVDEADFSLTIKGLPKND